MSSPAGNPRQGVCPRAAAPAVPGWAGPQAGAARRRWAAAAGPVTRAGDGLSIGPGNSAGPGARQLPAAAGMMIVFLLLYADFTVAGRCRIGFTVPEVMKYLDGVPCRAPLEVEVLLDIYLVAVLVTQK